MNIPHWCSQVYSQFSANHLILMGRNIEYISPNCWPDCQTWVITSLYITYSEIVEIICTVYVTTKVVHVDINSLLSHRSLLSFIFSFFDLTFFSSTSVKTQITHRVNVTAHEHNAHKASMAPLERAGEEHDENALKIHQRRRR